MDKSGDATWNALLSYIEYVYCAEGTHFLDDIIAKDCFTPEEWYELEIALNTLVRNKRI